VPSYLVETYLARGHATEHRALERRARSAADELTQEGTHVHLERSIYIPEDETCFFVFDAPVADDASLAATRAGLDPVRVVEAIPSELEER
jgi:hypothetical protein